MKSMELNEDTIKKIKVGDIVDITELTEDGTLLLYGEGRVSLICNSVHKKKFQVERNDGSWFEIDFKKIPKYHRILCIPL